MCKVDTRHGIVSKLQFAPRALRLLHFIHYAFYARSEFYDYTRAGQAEAPFCEAVSRVNTMVEALLWCSGLGIVW